MHDFNCTKTDDMNFELMADRTRYLKENPEGMSEMCKIMEDMRIESLKEVALRMLAAGKYALEEIASISGLSLDEVKKLKTDQSIQKNRPEVQKRNFWSIFSITVIQILSVIFSACLERV